MKHMKPFCVILGFSFLGEALHALIPLPVPASIYGLLALFAALALRWIRAEQIAETGSFLTSLLPLLFVSSVVSLLDCWDRVTPALLPVLTIIVVSTLLTFGISGGVTQKLMDRRERKNRHA